MIPGKTDIFRIGIPDPTLFIDDEVARRGRLNQHPAALFAFAEGLFGGFAFGDIAEGALDLGRVRRPNRRTGGHNSRSRYTLRSCGGRGARPESRGSGTEWRTGCLSVTAGASSG